MTTPANPAEKAPEAPVKDTSRADARKTVRVVMQEYLRRDSVGPVLRLFIDFTFLVVCIIGACYFKSWWAKSLMVIPASIAIARLFVIGHDACHGSYTRYDWLNKIIGRIAFLPSLTPFSLWDVGHNVAHHGFTNLKGRDQVWVPMSAEEWQQASKGRRFLERIYRSGFGQGLYYLIEMWWKKLILPTKKHVGVRRASFWWDNALVLGVGAAWITSLVLWAKFGHHSVTWTLLAGFVLPFLAFNCIMGFVIYVQHTHPDVAWFDKREEWQKRLGFITTTINVVVPKRMGQILHDILEHGAHHVNTGVPLYRLRAAQAALKTAVPNLARTYVLSWKRYWATVRTCKLYDYANHQWLDFKGRVTGAPLFPDNSSAA
jgi:omega-6 fatty acid desaturase (delta-12 desaturase)